MENLVLTALRDTVSGEGVFSFRDKLLFAHGILAGESAEILSIQEEKKFYTAKANLIGDISSERVEPACPLAGVCGGCALSHCSFSYETAVKQKHVEECLRRIGKTELSNAQFEPIFSPSKFGYRNKAEFIVRSGVPGLYDRESAFLPVKNCRLLSETMNIFLQRVENHLPHWVEGLVLRENDEHQLMAIVTSSHPAGSFKKIADGLFSIDSNLISVGILKKHQRSHSALDGEMLAIYGEQILKEHICGLSFSLTPFSFFQVNRMVASEMYSYAVNMAELCSGDTVLDAYCGLGAIGMLAAATAGQVYGIELITEAVDAARKAALENRIKNISFLAGRCESILPHQPWNKKLTTAFLDPPRQGCDKILLDAIVSTPVKRIVYISCNPATLARDIAYLRQYDFLPGTIRCFNMFFRTGQIESVVLLSRK